MQNFCPNTAAKSVSNHIQHREGIMSKGLITKKATKKEATKTLKEKRAAKQLKKQEKGR
jgi:hypothetical protein